MTDYTAVINLQQQRIAYRITLIGRLIKELRCVVVVFLINGSKWCQMPIRVQ